MNSTELSLLVPRTPPAGQVCEECKKEPAVRRMIWMEADGPEYQEYLCDDCYEIAKKKSHTGRCSWCKEWVDSIRWLRDEEDGSCGLYYPICKSCWKKEDERIQEELEWFQLTGYWY